MQNLEPLQADYVNNNIINIINNIIIIELSAQMKNEYPTPSSAKMLISINHSTKIYIA